jgi:hypothetical protein
VGDGSKRAIGTPIAATTVVAITPRRSRRVRVDGFFAMAMVSNFPSVVENQHEPITEQALLCWDAGNHVFTKTILELASRCRQRSVKNRRNLAPKSTVARKLA